MFEGVFGGCLKVLEGCFGKMEEWRHLARPKSHSLTMQCPSRRTLDGLRSLWITLPGGRGVNRPIR